MSDLTPDVLDRMKQLRDTASTLASYQLTEMLWRHCSELIARAERVAMVEEHNADLRRRLDVSLENVRLVMGAKLEDAAAEQSRNESMRVQRLVDRVNALEAGFVLIRDIPNEGSFYNQQLDARRIAIEALEGGGE